METTNNPVHIETLTKRVTNVEVNLGMLLEHSREIRDRMAEINQRMKVLERRVEERLVHVDAKANQILELLQQRG